MSKRKPLRKSEIEPLLFVRWVLLLVSAAEAAGIDSLSRHRLHGLLFMSFASARFYKLTPLRFRAQRTPHGPYYSGAHIALGRLVLSGLVELIEFSPYPSHKDLQFEGSFRPTVHGLEVAANLRLTRTGQKIYRFLLDICLASVIATPEIVSSEGIDNRIFDKVLEQDLTYQHAIKRGESFLSLRDGDDILTPTEKCFLEIEKHFSEKYLQKPIRYSHENGNVQDQVAELAGASSPKFDEPSIFVNRRQTISAYQKILRKRIA